jgi:hypothetical protein
VLYLVESLAHQSLFFMLHYFAKYYYTIPVQIILNLIFIAGSVVNFKKLKSLKILLPYGILSFVQCIIGVYLNVFVPYSRQTERLLENTINLFMLVEFVLFYTYIIVLMKHRLWLRIVLIIVQIVFSVTILWYWFFTDSFNEAPSSFTIIESYLIILGCLSYFFDLFFQPMPVQISSNPQFWSITGMLLLFAFLIPLTLQLNNIFKNFHAIYNALYSINFLGYSTLFAFLIISLRCQIRIIT